MESAGIDTGTIGNTTVFDALHNAGERENSTIRRKWTQEKKEFSRCSMKEKCSRRNNNERIVGTKKIEP